MNTRKGLFTGRCIRYCALLGGIVFIAVPLFGGRPLDAALFSDLLFLPGMSILLYGLFLAVINSGLFRAASYGFRTLNRHILRGEKAGAEGKRDEYYRYVNTRKKKGPFRLSVRALCFSSSRPSWP